MYVRSDTPVSIAMSQTKSLGFCCEYRMVSDKLTWHSVAMVPPTVYYSKVGLELAKLVFNGQKMSPP